MFCIFAGQNLEKMTANELRISNLLKVNGVRYIVDSLSSANNVILISRKGAILTTSLDEVEPISLTPDEFNRIDKEDWCFTGHGSRVIWQHKIFKAIKFELIPSNKVVICLNDQPINIKDYVHELQNLYFALTGQELTI